ncbi:MAG: ribose transport system ATP-binding protein [Thermoleophilaceae bacterium]|jgi:ribose transport system ATP-binding protein|nr:ribose transport system ATP-binding protein [Thermoleophilaceae bacterium]
MEDRRVAAVDGVSKSFAGTRALDDVGLEISAGKVHALVGSNGSGKSTLVKILAGIVPADSGVLLAGGESHDLTAFGPADARAQQLHFVHQERSVFEHLTVSENLSVGRGFETGGLYCIRRRAVRARTRRVLERFHIEADPDAEVGTLRPAIQTMLAIARVLQDQEDTGGGLLVLDEPTAALGPSDADMLLAAVRRYAAAGQGILFISHRLEEVLEVSDVVTVLRDGRHIATLPRAELDHDRLVELIVGRQLVPHVPEQLHGNSTDTSIPLIEASGFGGGMVDGIDFALRPGEIVGISGLGEAGCSNVLQMLFGAERTERGQLRVGGEAVDVRNCTAAMELGIAFVPANRAAQALFPEQPVLNNITIASVSNYWKGGALRQREERRAADEDVRRFTVRAANTRMPVSQLSGGNQQKVILARWLRRSPRILLLDEPTQGVDIGARSEIWGMIKGAVAGGAGALVVSSDVEELAEACDRVLIMRRGRLVHEITDKPLVSQRIVELLHSVEMNNGYATR